MTDAAAPPASVWLTPRRMADAPLLYPVLSEPALYTYLDISPPDSEEALRDLLARSEGRRSPDGTEHWLNWLVWWQPPGQAAADAQVAGYVQATVQADGDTFLAYMIGSRFWGQGIARQATQQMIGLVVGEPAYGAQRLLIQAEARHQRSVHLAQVLGFVPAEPALLRKHQVPAADVLLQRAPHQPV